MQTEDPRIAEVVDFWVGAGPEAWYKQEDAFDAEIRERFGALWADGAEGALDGWGATARGSLALLILLDQFPRNMFRGDARSFATDARALDVAAAAIETGQDMETGTPERQFFYMPFMHSEELDDQDRCVALMADRMEGSDNHLHARVHREIIRRFGRFPYRNDALGRETTEEEQAFLASGGYGAILRAFEDTDSA